MANFDAMVPLIPRDPRAPVDQAREQLKVNQLQKIKELRALTEEESSTVNNEKQQDRNPSQEQSSSQPEPQPAADAEVEEPGDDDTASSGHIDTYA